MKNIMGVGTSEKRMLSALGLQTLQERRDVAPKKFAIKIANSGRFAKWFPRDVNHFMREEQV